MKRRDRVRYFLAKLCMRYLMPDFIPQLWQSDYGTAVAGMIVYNKAKFTHMPEGSTLLMFEDEHYYYSLNDVEGTPPPRILRMAPETLAQLAADMADAQGLDRTIN